SRCASGAKSLLPPPRRSIYADLASRAVMAKPLGDQDGPCRGLPGWTLLFLTDVYRAYGFSAAMLICLAGILVTLGIGILIAHAAEFYVKRSDLAEEGNRVADLLDGLRLAGNPVVDAQTIVNT